MATHITDTALLRPGGDEAPPSVGFPLGPEATTTLWKAQWASADTVR